MHFSENTSLKPYNTFGIDVMAKHFVELFTDDEITSFLKHFNSDPEPLLVLGGGSNVLFSGDYNGTVAKISTKGIVIREENDESVLLHAEAGENWDDFVGYCVKNGWGGLENLSLIPGNVGTSPVQNIGAYGAEMKDVLHSVDTINTTTLEKRVFAVDECGLGYRESVFKQELKGKYIITGVSFRLSKNPELNLGYSAVREELIMMKAYPPGIQSLREAVIRIRRRKLPDPAVTGNAGSFFKNPVITMAKLDFLKAQYPGIPSFIQKECIRIPAAWLIGQCGWKGKRFGDAGVHINQPLVLVNHGHATGAEILDLARRIRDSVNEKFGITLETEVNIV